jgi:hypothetical protein
MRHPFKMTEHDGIPELTGETIELLMEQWPQVELKGVVRPGRGGLFYPHRVDRAVT